MFTLRQQHQAAFQNKAEVDFVQEVMSYLYENHTDTVVRLPTGAFNVEDLPEESLQKMVEGGIAKAKSYGITWESALTSYVVIMFVSAPNFDENINIQTVLSDERELPDRRIDNLWTKTDNEIWDEVIKNYEPNCWNNNGFNGIC